MALPRPRLPTAACVVAVLLTTVCRGAPVRHFIDWSDLNVARHYPRYSDVKAGVDAGGGRRVISVSKDGAGDATTVQGAVDMVPGGNTERVKIMISPGVYREKVIVPKSKPFISFIGDGTSATVISFHLRASDQFSNGETVGTYDSATVAVESDFFCANGITFENIDALLREQQKSRAVFDSELGELNIYRSGSAPPTVEGSRTVFGSLFGPVGFGESQGFRRAADTRLSDEEMRSHPDYSSYYYWNPKLNPRMPPPAISREDWRARQRFHGGISSYGGIGDHRGRTEFVDATDFSGSSLFSLQPGFPKHAEQDEMAPGTRVLYLGAASGTTVSHVSDLVGPARILGLNASYFLKSGGHFVISIKFNCDGEGADLRGRVPWARSLAYEEAKPFLDRGYVDGDQWLSL